MPEPLFIAAYVLVVFAVLRFALTWRRPWPDPVRDADRRLLREISQHGACGRKFHAPECKCDRE